MSGGGAPETAHGAGAAKPAAQLGARRGPWRRDIAGTLRWVGAVAFGAAGLVHVGLLAYIFATRLTAPFDLEWMEGGMLTHALRIMHGEGVYVAPSNEFISYLYTPGYPALVAAFGKLFGVSYTLGRVISVLSFAGVCALSYRVVSHHVERSLAGSRWEARLWAVGVLGLLCASFQHTGAWYDLVRNDSLYLLLVCGGLALLFYRHDSWPHLIAGSMLLGLGFLTKQTTALFIVFSGFAMLALAWRRLPVHVVVVGLVAGGSTLLLDALSHGWFWEYIYQLHQGHDVYWDRMLLTTPQILAEATPVPAAIFCIGLLVLIGRGLAAPLRRLLGRRAYRQRERLEEESAWLFWWCVALTGIAVACTGYGTQWADFNAFIPGLVFPAIFAAIGPAGLARRLGVRGRPLAAALITLLFGLALAAQLALQLYSPKPHVPRAGDRARARQLISALHEVRGEILFPYHPFMPYMAGKSTQYHQMGINDVTRAGHPYPGGIRQKIEAQKYGAIVLDKRPVDARYGYLLQTYKLARYFPATSVPLTVTGYRVRPRYLFVPKRPPPKPPRGARSVFDFEDGSYQGWKRHGRAWGARPAGGSSSNQQLAGPFSGRYLASSALYGDAATGTLRSPQFVVDRPVLTYRVGGGRNRQRLMVKLIVNGKVVHKDTGTQSHVMKTRRVDVSRYRGRLMRVELVDRARKGAYAYLLFDDLMLRQR